jgi:hypothetical protein
MVAERFDKPPAKLDEALQELESLMQHGQRQAGRTSFVNDNEIGGIARTDGDKAYSNFAAGLAASLTKYFK